MSKKEKLKTLIAICIAVISLYIISYICNVPVAPTKHNKPVEIFIPVVSIVNEINPNKGERSQKD